MHQIYKVCLRQNENRCAVFYKPTNDDLSFALDGSASAKAGSGDRDCRFDYLIFHDGTSPGVPCMDSTSMTLNSNGMYD